MRRALPALLLVAAGCGLNTTTKSGKVGDKLSAGGLHVTLIKFDTEPPGQRGTDITGFSTPAPGQRFFGAKVELCDDRDLAKGTYDFSLKLDDGKAKVHFPQSVYDDGFDSVRTGCGTGWIVFEGPKGSAAKSLKFNYDDTGSGAGQPSGKPEKHARFSWDVASR